jgi:hypothetical protein
MFGDVVGRESFDLIHFGAVYLDFGAGMTISPNSAVDMVTLMRLFGEEIGAKDCC